MRNLLRINNYYNRIAAREDYDKLAATLNRYGLASQLVAPKSDTWRAIDAATNATKAKLVTMPVCPHCENKSFTVKVSELLDAQGCISCDLCDEILEPLERVYGPR